MSIPQQRVPQAPQGNPVLLNELQSEVSHEAAPLLQFILKHAGIIVAGLVLFVLVLAGTAGYNWYNERARQDAQKELAQVLLANEGEKLVTALEGFIPKAPATIRNAALLNLASAAMEQKAYAKAATASGDLAAADPQGAVGLLAALNQGQALILADKAQEAVTVLEKLQSLMPEGQRNVVRESLAEAALRVGDTTKAKQIFELMANSTMGAEAEFFRYRVRTIEQDATK